MKITEVEPQKNNPHRFNIFLDGQFAFGADEDLVVNRRLVVGKEISKEDLQEILKEAEVGKLMEKMYRLFSIRMRSEKEIRDYFKISNFKFQIVSNKTAKDRTNKEKYSDFVIDATVETLKKKGMINDLEFAKAWFESRSKKYGTKKIKQELFQKGIDKVTIEQVTSDKSLESREEEIAEKYLEKKMNIWKSLPEMEIKKKATEYLLRRGFEYPVAKLAIDKFLSK